jgi:hypothetical protein
MRRLCPGGVLAAGRGVAACLVAASWAVAQAPAPAPHLAVFADGAEVPGTVADLGDRAKAAIAGRRLFDPAKPVRWVRFGAAVPKLPAAFVEFDNGDILPGAVVGHRPEGFEWRELVGSAQPMNHPESLPARLLVAAAADVLAPDRLLARPAGDAMIASRIDVRRDRVRRIVWRSDVPHRQRPKTLFLADGTVREFKSVRWADDAVIALLADGSTDRYPFAAIAELHLAPRPDPWDAWFETLADDDGGVVQMVCRSGARVSIPQRQCQAAHGLASMLAQPTWTLDPLFLPIADIVRLLAFAPAEAPLSFLEPTRVAQASPLGGSLTWKADVNVQGGPLDLAGPPVGWGFGVQARTELALPLAAGVKEFRGRAGLDRIVGVGGCFRASIHANDAASPALWQSDILVGSGTCAVCGSLPLAGPDGGQKELVLVADEAHRDRPPGADPFDIRDTVDWADPLVVLDPAVAARRTATRLAAAVPAWAGWTMAAEPAARVRLLSQIDPVLPNHRAGWAVITVAEGGPLRLARTWQTLRPQDRFLVAAVSGYGPAKGPLTLRVDGWQWDLVPPARSGDHVVPFVLPLDGRPDGPLAVEIVAPAGQQVQWHALGLAGPLDVGWFPLEPMKMEAKNGSKFTRRDDGAILVGMPAPARDTYTIRLRSPEGGIRALRLDALLDPSLPKPACGPGTGQQGRFAIGALDVSAVAADGAATPVEVVAGFSHPLQAPGAGPLDAVRRARSAYLPNPHWGGAGATMNSAVLHFRAEQAAAEEIVVGIDFGLGDHFSLGCFRFYGSADPVARLPVVAVTLVREPTPNAPPPAIVVGRPVEPVPTP